MKIRLKRWFDPDAWHSKHRVQFQQHRSWHKPVVIDVGPSWDEAFGELRSMTHAPLTHPVQRMRFHLLVYRAMKEDLPRYREEWVPYIEQDPELRLLQRSVALERELCLSRVYGMVMVHLCRTDPEQAKDKAGWAKAIVKAYGLAHERLYVSNAMPKEAKSAILQLLQYEKAYDVKMMPQDEAERLLEVLLGEFTDSITWLWVHGTIQGATFETSLVLIGPKVSGLIVFWDED